MVDNPFPNPIIPHFHLDIVDREKHPIGSVYTINHDEFKGEVIGYYKTREGKEGVVLQQIGTKVVHVYDSKWLEKS